MIRVVIADDNLAFLQILSTYLALNDDIEIVGLASDGTHAVRLITESKPDIVLLDTVMPQLDGIGVLKFIRKMKPGVKPDVIMITALVSDGSSQKAIENGAALIMPKPFDMNEMVTAIRKLYHMKKMFSTA